MSEQQLEVKQIGEKSDGHTRRQAAKRAEILAAAKDVFFRKGYARTSMDDIQQVVGGSKRTLYSYFRAKEDLYAEIIREVAEQIVPDCSSSFTPDLIADLRMLGKRYLSTLLLPETLELYRGVIAEAPHLPALADIFFEKGPGHLIHSLQERFTLAHESGQWNVLKPGLAAQQFLAMLRSGLHGPALIQGRTAPKAEIEQCVEDAIATLLHGAVSGNAGQSSR